MVDSDVNADGNDEQMNDVCPEFLFSGMGRLDEKRPEEDVDPGEDSGDLCGNG